MTIRRLLFFAAPIVALLAVAKFANTSPPTNFARTSPDAPPELRSRLYTGTLDEVEESVRDVVRDQRKYGGAWRLVFLARADEIEGRRRVDVEVPVLFFTDDLTVTLEEQGKQVRVDVESRSRVGKGDFGENRRHIAQLLAALDLKLG